MTARVFECKDIVFAHAVNSLDSLRSALSDPFVNFLEADVVCGAKITEGDKEFVEPLMGHDPGKGGVPFRIWLEEAVGKEVSCAGVGIKVDIKDWEALTGVLHYITAVNDKITQGNVAPWPFLRFRRGTVAWFDRPAIMINADVLTGTTDERNNGCKFNPLGKVVSSEEQVEYAKAFINTVLSVLENAILSLGWTTVASPAPPQKSEYTPEMIDSMRAVVDEFASISVAITFAVKANYVRPSWAGLQSLIRYPLASLTLWAHQRPREDERWFYSTLDNNKTMYDIGKHPAEDVWWGRITLVAMLATFVVGAIAHERRCV